MYDFLKEENVSKEKAAIFQLTFKQVGVQSVGFGLLWLSDHMPYQNRTWNKHCPPLHVKWNVTLHLLGCLRLAAGKLPTQRVTAPITKLRLQMVQFGQICAVIL